MFESLQLLKSAYWNGHSLAADDATQHLDVLITALEDEVDNDMPSLATLNSQNCSLLSYMQSIGLNTLYLIFHGSVHGSDR